MIARSSLICAGVALLALSGCKDRKEPEPLASLVAVHAGTVDKSLAGASWTRAAAGDDFGNGDALRTSADGSARLRIVDSLLDLGASTLLSFGERIEVTGELRPVGGDVELELAVGDVTIRQGSAVRVGDQRFEILVGAASVERGGETFALEVGDSLVLEVGGAAVERRRPPDAGAVDAAPEPAADIRVTVTGRAATIQEPGKEGRQRLRGDAVLAAGTTLRLPRRSRAELSRGPETLSLQGPAVVVAGADDGALAAMRSGQGTASATSADVILELPGGRLVVEAGPGDGSAAEVSVNRRGARVQVRRGVARLGGEGAGEVLRHGESAAISPRGRLSVTSRAPAVADATLRGDARVHTRGRSVALRVDFSSECPGDGVVELAGRRGFDAPAQATRGPGAANLLFERGRSRYRVRCVRDGVIDDEAALSGTVRVDGELGTREIAQVPPTSNVEADGRRYTVLYQNKLPAIVFAWRDAPRADGYELVVERQGSRRSRRFDSAEPRVSVKAGQLREGEYRFRFESARGSSRESSLRIAFDNAASSAYISSPGFGEAWRGDSLLVAGATLPGWRVRANGVELPTDRQERFRRRIPRPADGRLGIEFVHPQRGRHIYIRRSADAR